MEPTVWHPLAQDQAWLDRLDEAGILMWEEALGPNVKTANTQDPYFMGYQVQQLNEVGLPVLAPAKRRLLLRTPSTSFAPSIIPQSQVNYRLWGIN